jgi:hypothetical protein
MQCLIQLKAAAQQHWQQRFVLCAARPHTSNHNGGKPTIELIFFTAMDAE